MVSLHTPPLSPSQRKIIPEFEDSSKKRKWEEPLVLNITNHKLFSAKSKKSISETELNLETPLPLEWQRCLDIKSGFIYFYNTKTQKRTLCDPRASPEPPCPGDLSLDLELNLLCGTVGKNQASSNLTRHNSSSSFSIASDQFTYSGRDKKNTEGMMRVPSWLTIEGDHQEMITAVCKKCHMLVMMSKLSPACPNCKFMHPPSEHSQSIQPEAKSFI